MATLSKLEKLLIGEVSGVDFGANLIDGWMIAKSRDGADADALSFVVGPEQPWVVGEAEARVRAATGAEDGPSPKYAACFLWQDGEAELTEDGVPASYGAYKFLVADVIDGQLAVMPKALEAVKDRLETSSLTDEAKADVAKTVSALEVVTKSASQSAGQQDAPSILDRLRKVLDGKDEIEMTQDELNAALDARMGALGDELVEKLRKSVEAPSAEGAPAVEAAPAVEPAATPETPAEPQLSIEDVTKAIEEGMKPYHDIFEAVIDRVGNIETALGIAARKSLDGQEGEARGEEPQAPTTQTAIAKALQGHRVTLR